jgi:hypothetical protein
MIEKITEGEHRKASILMDSKIGENINHLKAKILYTLRQNNSVVKLGLCLNRSERMLAVKVLHLC